MTRLYCDGPTLMRAVAAAVANLERHVDEVDAMNVFPVPDGDTGSNMLATMRAALGEAERLPEGDRSLEAVAEALSRGALTGARGNSGVILSQIIRGMTDGADGRRLATGIHLAQGLRRGSEVAYRSVLTPVEGTILTVIRDAADAAEAAAGRQPHVEAVLTDAIEAAATSVARTPSLLPILQDAGVVDSGGQGLLRLLEGTIQIATVAPGEAVPAASTTAAAIPVPRVVRPDGAAAPDRRGGDGFGYEATFLLTAVGTALDIERLRAEFEGLGESVVVAGDARAVRVHIHTGRPDLAIGAGLRSGRLGDVSITDLDLQAAAHVGGRGVAIVAVAAADGLAAALASVGVDRLIRPAEGTRPSIGEIAEAIRACGAAHVIVLPNDPDTALAARQAADLAPLVRTAIVPTRNVAEGIAAILAFDPAADVGDNVGRMGREASALRSFSVAPAVRDATLDGVAVRRGEHIAIGADSRLLARGDDLAAATLEGIALIGADAELVTLYTGAGVDGETASALADAIAAARPGAEVEVLEGGQRQSSLLVAVE